jgi:hypothetical protein
MRGPCLCCPYLLRNLFSTHHKNFPSVQASWIVVTNQYKINSFFIRDFLGTWKVQHGVSRKYFSLTPKIGDLLQSDFT